MNVVTKKHLQSRETECHKRQQNGSTRMYWLGLLKSVSPQVIQMELPGIMTRSTRWMNLIIILMLYPLRIFNVVFLVGNPLWFLHSLNGTASHKLLNGLLLLMVTQEKLWGVMVKTMSHTPITNGSSVM